MLNSRFGEKLLIVLLRTYKGIMRNIRTTYIKQDGI